MEPITTGQIYWGAVPFVIIQIIMVGLVIAFPQMVMHYKAPAATAPAGPVEIRIPPPGGMPGGLPGLPGGLPWTGLPPIAPPSFGDQKK